MEQMELPTLAVAQVAQQAVAVVLLVTAVQEL
jgi:hypothetical protein